MFVGSHARARVVHPSTGIESGDSTSRTYATPEALEAVAVVTVAASGELGAWVGAWGVLPWVGLIVGLLVVLSAPRRRR